MPWRKLVCCMLHFFIAWWTLQIINKQAYGIFVLYKRLCESTSPLKFWRSSDKFWWAWFAAVSLLLNILLNMELAILLIGFLRSSSTFFYIFNQLKYFFYQFLMISISDVTLTQLLGFRILTSDPGFVRQDPASLMKASISEDGQRLEVVKWKPPMKSRKYFP